MKFDGAIPPPLFRAKGDFGMDSMGTTLIMSDYLIGLDRRGGENQRLVECEQCGMEFWINKEAEIGICAYCVTKGKKIAEGQQPEWNIKSKRKSA